MTEFQFKPSFTIYKITSIRLTENQPVMRVARRDVRILFANETALQRDINYPAQQVSLKSNKLFRPVLGPARIQRECTDKKKSE